jgi:lipoprotein-releasing system permease protein
MNLPLKIAFRYLFGKKSINAINIITGISILGISIGTAALILILSVFNGFEDLIEKSLNAFNPDIKITPAKGKFFQSDDKILDLLTGIDGISSFSLVLEEVAYLKYGNNRTVGIIKGVDENYQKINNIDSLIEGGVYNLETENADFGIPGAGLANKLGISPDASLAPISLYLLKSSDAAITETNFKTADVLPSGRFSVPDDIEMKYIIISLDLSQYLLDQEGIFSAIEIKTNKDFKKVKTIISEKSGNSYIIKDRLEQDEELRKIINLERLVAYAIITLTLLLLAFNMIGSLWIIVLDKKNDISVLQAMGATKKNIKSIFMFEGLLISSISLIIGVLMALIFYFIQVNYGIIGVGDSQIIDSYPISLRFLDFITVTLTVLFITLVINILPAKKASSIDAIIREE